MEGSGSARTHTKSIRHPARGIGGEPLGRRFSKAFLLAAGLGTRLRPLTQTVPKCLVPVDGKPLLRIWLDICEGLGVRDVLINTHHLAEEVRAWAKRERTSVRIQLSHEPELLGSAGTVSANRDFIEGEDDFFVFYADNLVHGDLEALKLFHQRHSGVLTLALFRSPNPQACGVVTLDESGCVTSFEEKPSRPRSNLANAGLYVARRRILDYVPRSGFADFGKDILPGLVGRMWGTILDGYLLDVGTPQSYQKAQVEWPRVSRRNPPQGPGRKSEQMGIQSG